MFPGSQQPSESNSSPWKCGGNREAGGGWTSGCSRTWRQTSVHTTPACPPCLLMQAPQHLNSLHKFFTLNFHLKDFSYLQRRINRVFVFYFIPFCFMSRIVFPCLKCNFFLSICIINNVNRGLIDAIQILAFLKRSKVKSQSEKRQKWINSNIFPGSIL